MALYPKISERCEGLSNNFDEIPQERKNLLEKLSAHLSQKLRDGKELHINYICTHNSRRSHLGQVWAAVAAAYYGIEKVYTYSGGTTATACHFNTINALKNAGFDIEKTSEGDNPVYHIGYGENAFATCFSKTFDHEINPSVNFVAVMTCSDAEQNCPFVPGCDLRIGTTYFDPKAYDQTSLVEEKYTERSNQIGKECLYVFSKIEI